MRLLLTESYEYISYAIFPSAERAYIYGEIHLSPAFPKEYDINLAQYYFAKAASYDPPLPYVYHQLARIAFIQGNLAKALVLIDTQINNEGEATPPSYYVRGLIEGYQGNYSDAESDYAHFLKLEPDNWAGINDYAWILLKDNKPQIAAKITALGIAQYPNNPWLLNSNATALYEAGDVADARPIVERAMAAVTNLSRNEWSVAYPGNNPAISLEGLETFKKAVADNMHTIFTATTLPSNI